MLFKNHFENNVNVQIQYVSPTSINFGAFSERNSSYIVKSLAD